MPLAGVLCEDPRHYGEPHSFEEYLELVKTGQCRTHCPIEMIVAMARNAEDRRDAGLSATVMLDCPRRVVLSQMYDYYEYPSRYWARFRGTLGHMLMEAYDEGDPDVIREIRYRKNLEHNGVSIVITGKPDKINLREKLIIDFKSIREVPVEPKITHEQQINIYRWLLWGGQPLFYIDDKAHWGEPVYHSIERAGIQYFDMDMPLKLSVPIWTLEATEDFIRSRVETLIQWDEGRGEMPPIWLDETGKRHKLCAPEWCPLREICDNHAKNMQNL